MAARIPPRVVLSPGVRLRGGRLEFGSKGVLLTRDNTIEDIEVVVPEHEVAIYADKVVVLRDRAHVTTLSGDSITVPAVLSTIAAETQQVA